MVIQIIDTKNSKTVGLFPVILLGSNYTPSYDEAYEQAWICAVEDELVDVDRKSDYTFHAIER